MIELPISENQIKRAENLYEFKGLNGSIMSGESNIYGALGEILVHDYFESFHPKFISNFDYDLIIKDFKIDVKTKRTTVKPKDHYLCSICLFNVRQNCDYYFFCRVRENLKTGYLLGYIEKCDFFKKSTFYKKGEKDCNGFTFKADGFHIKINELNNFTEILNSINYV